MNRLRRLRRGDRDALKELVAEHGAALEQLSRAMDAPAAEAVVAVWKASVLPGTEDERAFVIMAGLTGLAGLLPKPEAQVPEVDPSDLAFQIARVELGLGDDLDRNILNATLAEHPEVEPLREQFLAALNAARAAPAGAGGLDALWNELQPRLT